MTEEKKAREKDDDHSVFIGNRPFMNYVTGVVMQFTTQNSNEVIVKARGKYISKAVDVSEVVRKRFLDGQVDLSDVKIDSAEFKNKEDKLVRVSSIELTLKRK